MILCDLGNRFSTYPGNDGIIWKPIYKWSGANSTWLEYLGNATNEIQRHINQDEASKETAVVRERRYRVLKTLFLQPPPPDIPVSKSRPSTIPLTQT